MFVVCWCSSLAIYELERERQPETFAKMSDAAWYVLTTMTTVGYGDKVPVTTRGRVVAACTMIAGLALFGTFISLIGSAFLEEVRQNSLGHRLPSNMAWSSADSASVPESLRAMTQDGFDPHEVSQVIGRSALGTLSGAAHLETVRLLAVACQVMIDDGKGQKQNTGPYN